MAHRVTCSWRPTWLLNLMILAVSGVVAWWSIWLDIQQLKHEHSAEVSRIDRQLTQRVNSLETVLISLGGLYHASDELNLAELTGFSEELLRAYPHIKSIFHLQKVTWEEHSDFEDVMLEEGLIGFRIYRHSSSTRQDEQPSGHFTLPIDFIEPMDPLVSSLLGYDFGSHPGTQKAIDQAVIQNRVVATDQLQLKTSLPPAFYVMKPVYLGRYPPKTTAERIEMLSGVVVLEISVETFLNEAHLSPSYTLITSRQSPTQVDAGDSPHSNDVSLILRNDDKSAPRLLSTLHLSAYGQQLHLQLVRPVALTNINLVRLAWMWLGAMLVLGLLTASFAGRRSAQARADAAATLAAAEGERFSQVVDNAFDAVITTDSDGSIVSWNRMAEYMFGYPASDVMGKKMAPLILTSESKEAIQKELTSMIQIENRQRQSRHLETRGFDRSGKSFPMELALSRADVHGEPLLSVFARDITQREESDQQIRTLAYYDTLTQLPNRELFKEQTAHAITAAKRYQRNGAVLYLDLDGFKRINDTLGHDLGDRLLVGVAERLKSQLRTDDQIARAVPADGPEEEKTIARLGGDEFTVLLTEVRAPLSVTVVARRIQQAISKPFILAGHEVYVTPSVGIAMFPGDGADVDEILKNADTAMYHAKSIGKNNFQFYAEDMNARSSNRLKLEGDLRRAMEREELRLEYQPQIDIATGEIIAAEALLRWHHPELGEIAPFEFIPLAEETGMIIGIGEWVLQEACRQNKVWLDEGTSPIKVAINLSPVQFIQRDLNDAVRRALKDTGLPAEYLELEITESILMRNVEETIAALHGIREMGVGLSVDDFGTGYSSLSYLKRFPIDSLKIDRSFVKDIPQDTGDMAITAAIIAMGHQLNLEIVAEGVESQEQLEFLRLHGCETAQGYLISKPVTADELHQLLVETTTDDGEKKWASGR